jgi:hypothetical protein
MSTNMKLAQRDLVPLSRRRERDGERETGTMGFIIRNGIVAMPVSQR